MAWAVGSAAYARYLDLYLECVISPVNAGMLYHIAAKVKQVKGLDMTGNPDEDNTVRLMRRDHRDSQLMIPESLQIVGAGPDHHPKQGGDASLEPADLPRKAEAAEGHLSQPPQSSGRP